MKHIEIKDIDKTIHHIPVDKIALRREGGSFEVYGLGEGGICYIDREEYLYILSCIDYEKRIKKRNKVDKSNKSQPKD